MRRIVRSYIIYMGFSFKERMDVAPYQRVTGKHRKHPLGSQVARRDAQKRGSCSGVYRD